MFIVIGLIFGVICALVANGKGRSAVGWFFLGFLFGLISLIIVCVISDLKKEEARERALRNENRRLRERMRKDRMVADQRHRQLDRRINAHDRVAGIDTAQPENEQLLEHVDDEEFYDDEDDFDQRPRRMSRARGR